MVMHLMMIRMVLLRRISSGRYHSPSSAAAALLMLLLATAVIVIVIIFVVVVIARVVCVQEYVPGGKVRIALRSLSVVLLLLLLSSVRRRMERIVLHSSGRGRRVETSTRENDGHPVLITVRTVTTRRVRCFGES